jgi:hypothetical protein
MIIFSKIWWIIVLVLTGCSSTHFVKNDATALRRLNQEFKNRNATIFMNNGNTFEAGNLRITTDTTYYNRENSSKTRFVFTSDIKQILFLNQKRGAKRGGLISGIAGGIGGLILGVAIYFDPGGAGNEDIVWLPLTLTGAAMGTVIGQGIGSYIGVEEYYIFNQENGVVSRSDQDN